MDKILLRLATFGGIGFLPGAPGTWASAATALLWLAITYFLPIRPAPYWLIVAILFIVGLISAGAAEKILDRPDPGSVVIDEVVGQLIALYAAPAHPVAACAAFLLFRIFDIWKPFPVSWLDSHLHGGIGIMLDDVMAGIYALLVLQVGLFVVRLF